MSLYFTSPIPHKTVWGGKTLREYFQFPESFGDDIGQAWAFSAQEGKSSPLLGGGYDGRTLLDLWKEKPEVFQSRHSTFPFIISLVAPEDDLSIQVHPDDSYAKKLGYPSGKNEAWVFLWSIPGNCIVYGHNAKDQADLESYIAQNRWQNLVQKLPVATGDTVYIPAGTLHALSKDNVVYEIQQSTDITYRFYDYDRKDKDGKGRPLQLEQAIQCLHYDDAKGQANPVPTVLRGQGYWETICVSNDSFTVRRLQCSEESTLCYPVYQLITVVEGEGTVDGHPLHRGVSFLLPANETITIHGSVTLMATAEQ